MMQIYEKYKAVASMCKRAKSKCVHLRMYFFVIVSLRSPFFFHIRISWQASLPQAPGHKKRGLLAQPLLCVGGERGIISDDPGAGGFNAQKGFASLTILFSYPDPLASKLAADSRT
jgi:hypothetical protein